MSADRTLASDLAASGLIARPSVEDAAPIRGRYFVECHDRDGNLRWSEEIDNLVTSAGKQSILNQAIRQQAAQSWFVGLKDAGAVPAQTQTLAAKGGWAEITGYSQATRPAYTAAAPTTAGSNPNILATVTNTASQAQFTFTAQFTVAGFFIASASDKGGTTGTILSIADFTNARTLYTDDTLSVRYDLSI